MTLSISDIGALLKAIPQEKSLEVYDGFVKLQEAEREMSADILKDSYDKIAGHNMGEEENAVMTVLMLIIEANYRKQLAEKLIDKYFKGSEL
jgi:hypothetical protein